MTVRINLLAMALVVGSTAANAQSPGDYHLYFTETFAEYGQSVEDCETLRQTRQPPGADILQKLRQYDPQNVRVFLVYNDYKRMQNCSSNEAAQLLVAAGSLKNEGNLLEETRLAIEALEKTLFMDTDLDYEMKYRALPTAMRTKLEQMNYFQTPFQAFSVIDKL